MNKSPSTPANKEIYSNNTPSPVLGALMDTIKDVASNQSLVNSTHGQQRPTAMQKNVAPFLNKVYNMVNDPSSDDLIRWSSDGKSFFVVRHEDFARSVLPRFFKHSNFSSFVRQLNMYGFHKVPHLQHGVLHSDTDSEQWEFSNPHFQRNQPDLLLLVTRKKGRDNEDKDPASTSSSSSSSTAVTNIDLHHILEEIQVIKQHQMNISSQLKNIQNDNSVLWQETISARERHQRHQETIDKILRFLASVFSNDKSMAIPRKRQYLLEAPDTDTTANETQSPDIDYVNKDSIQPSKIQKTGHTPKFKLEDYVPGLQGPTPLSSSVTLPTSSPQSTKLNNPSSELADAIALNDKSKQSSAVSSLRMPMSITQDLSQVMSLQQIQGIQSLIGLAQSNPALLSHLTTEIINNYHQSNSANNNIPATVPATASSSSSSSATALAAQVSLPEFSPFSHVFDPSIFAALGNGNSNSTVATIPPALSTMTASPITSSSSSTSSSAYGTNSLVASPSRMGLAPNLTFPAYDAPAAIQPRPTVSSAPLAINDNNNTSRPVTSDTGINSALAHQTTTPPSSLIAMPPVSSPTLDISDTSSLPQISNDIKNLAKTANDINSDIDTLGSNIEALAQQLGFDPTKSNDDLLGYVDMDKFLQAYGSGEDTSLTYPTETISPTNTTPASPANETSSNSNLNNNA